MSAKTQRKQRDRLDQTYLDSLIEYKERNFSDPIEPEPPKVVKPVLFSEEEYDTLQPEETLKGFCALIRAMLARFESNKAELIRLESEMQDLLHFMEMTKDKNAREGYRLYKKMAEVRRQRRIRKNENDLLQPVYELFHATDMLDKLGYVQGQCRKMKQTIDSRGYSVRTDVLSEFVTQLIKPESPD